MEDLFEKKKKKKKNNMFRELEELEETYEYEEDSDLPVHETFVKGKRYKQ
ncbi:MAG: hypothetical protein ABII01_04950 [Candidatus Woesearchaeota archaeon]